MANFLKKSYLTQFSSTWQKAIFLILINQAWWFFCVSAYLIIASDISEENASENENFHSTIYRSSLPELFL